MKEKKKLIIAVVLILLLALLIFIIVQSGKTNELTITFDCHGGTQVENQKIKKGEKLEEPEAPTKEGYEFIGWYYDGEKFDFTKEIDENIKLEAKWLKVSNIKYTVSFDSNGGSSVTEQKVEKGEKAKKPENPTRSGYTFVEWELDGKAYDFNSKVEKNITLSAVWKANVVVRNDVPVTSTTRPTTTVSKPATKPPVQKPVVEEPVIEEPVTPVIKKYQVTFYDGNTLAYTQEVVEGGKVVRPLDLVKENYQFAGWVYNGLPFDFDTIVVGDIKLEAIWIPVLELKKAETIKLDSISSSEPYFTEIKHNQEAIDVVQVGNTITVTKKQPLTSYANSTTISKEWIALILDFGVDPSTIQGTDYQIETIDISDARRLGATTDTAFVVWVDAKDRQLTFKKIDDETVVGTVNIKVNYPTLTLNSVTKLTQVDPVTQDELNYNNNAITVSYNGNSEVTVVENKAMLGTTERYGLVFDFGIDPQYITVAAPYTMDTTNLSNYGITSNTAFIIWMNGKDVDETVQMTFTNQFASTDTLVVTIKYDAKVDVEYQGTEVVILPSSEPYDENRRVFTIEPTAAAFTFDIVDGTGSKKILATKQADGTWLFEDAPLNP